MGTTIHVEEETKQILETIKIRENASSIDQTIRFILSKSKEAPKTSLFGIDKGKKLVVERMKSHEI
ncbi:VapB-type antitoxin [Candidatus Woesearchaeota archaeon]|nr:VapB-type antitoxin [Candidatus Woesearchaeota archaeon]